MTTLCLLSFVASSCHKTDDSPKGSPVITLMMGEKDNTPSFVLPDISQMIENPLPISFSLLSSDIDTDYSYFYLNLQNTQKNKVCYFYVLVNKNSRKTYIYANKANSPGVLPYFQIDNNQKNYPLTYEDNVLFYSARINNQGDALFSPDPLDSADLLHLKKTINTLEDTTKATSSPNP